MGWCEDGRDDIMRVEKVVEGVPSCSSQKPVNWTKLPEKVHILVILVDIGMDNQSWG